MVTQDMPPPGGFAAINIERTFPKPMLRQGIWIVVLIAATINGAQVANRAKKRNRILRIETVENYIAAQPFMLAEQERGFLSHLRNRREEERELMKDHKGWVVGTLYGEKVFKTIPENLIPPLHPCEYTAFRPQNEWLHYVINPDFWQQ